MKILVASTVAAYKADGTSELAWLTHGPLWAQRDDVEFFCAVQTGQGHDEKFGDLEDALEDVGATVWRFSIDDGAQEITTGNRLHGICTGRNMAHEFVGRDPEITHLLFLDSDVFPPKDAIDRLTEVDHPIVGGHVPTYGFLDGAKVEVEPDPAGGYEVGWKYEPPEKPVIEGFVPVWDETEAHWHTDERPFPEGADVRVHWNTAGVLMLQREAVKRIRWGWSPDENMTDDPWTQNLAMRVGLGQTWVRHDVICRHYPERIGPLESRGHDLSIRREAACASS